MSIKEVAVIGFPIHERFLPFFSSWNLTHTCTCEFSSGGGLVAKSCPTLAILWTVACQAPLFMGCSRQEYWSGLPFPSPGNLPYPGIKPRSPALQADDLPTDLCCIFCNNNSPEYIYGQSLFPKHCLLSTTFLLPFSSIGSWHPWGQEFSLTCS